MMFTSCGENGKLNSFLHLIYVPLTSPEEWGPRNTRGWRLNFFPLSIGGNGCARIEKQHLFVIATCFVTTEGLATSQTTAIVVSISSPAVELIAHTHLVFGHWLNGLPVETSNVQTQMSALRHWPIILVTLSWHLAHLLLWWYPLDHHRIVT